MADNVQYQSTTLATPPAATTVATDEVQVNGTQPVAQVQFMKLVDGTLNGNQPIPGDSANGLDVDVTRLPSLPVGNNNIGDVDVASLPSLPAGNNNIGDVDVLTLPNTTNAGATAKTTDYDTGGGTDTVTMFGVALPGAGGAVAGGTATNPLRTDPTGTTAQPVTDNGGSLTVDDGGSTLGVDDNGGSLTIDAPTGTPVNVQIGDGTRQATVRDTGTSDSLNVAIVDGSGNQITSFGGGTQYAEDTAHVSGDQVTMAGVVQQSADAALSGDGDRAVLQVDANGYLKVNVKAGGGTGGTAVTDDAAFTAASGAVTPIGGFATADAVDAGDVGVVGMTTNRALYTTLRTPNNDSAMDDTNDAVRVNVVAGSGGGVTHTDDAAFTVTSDDGVPMFGMFDDVAPDSVDEGDAGVVRMSANRNLYIQIRDAAGNERGANVDASNRLTTAVTNNPVLGASTNNIGDVDVLTLPSIPAGTNNIGDVDIVTLPDEGQQTMAASISVAIASDQSAVQTQGQVAHDAVASGNPVVIGALASTATPSAVSADGDAVRIWADRNGRVNVNVGTALPAGTNNIGDVDVLTLPSIPAGNNNIGDVDIASAPTGASAIQIQGPAAHDAAAVGNPIINGGVAETTRPTAVADADAVNAWHDEMGRQVVQIGSGEDVYVSAEYTSSQTDTSLISAPGANLYIRIFDIVVSTGTAGTVLLEEDQASDARLFGRISLAANGGWSFNSAKGIKFAFSNSALLITTTTGAGPLSITVNYCIEP